MSVERKTASKNAIAWTASLGLFMAILDSTVVNVALTPMGSSLKADLGDIQWVITAYFLAQAAVIPLAGYFGQRFGIKRVFLICQVLFVIGSVLCGLSNSLLMLVIFRVIQGLGGGGLFPLAQAIALRAYPPQERANASAIIGVSALVAPALGPTVGGLITDGLGWEWIFYINVPVGLIAGYLAWRIIPADIREVATSKARFDYVGLSLSILGVLAIVYGLSLVSQTMPGTISQLQPRGEIYGWSYSWVWILLGAGALLLLIFAVYELRVSQDPVLDLRLLRNYNFTMGTLACCAVAMAVFGSIFILPVFLESVRRPHLSATEAGLLLLPQGVASAIAVILSGRILYNRFGVRNLVAFGAILLIIGTWGFTNLSPEQDSWSLVPWLIIRGLGFGWTFVPTQTRAMQELMGVALAKGSSLLNVMRQIFSSVGTAIVSTVFLQQTTAHVNELRAAALQNVPPGTVVTPTTEQIQTIAAKAGTMATIDIFWLVMAGSGLVFLLALTLPGRTKKSEVSSQKLVAQVTLD